MTENADRFHRKRIHWKAISGVETFANELLSVLYVADVSITAVGTIARGSISAYSSVLV